MGLRRASLFQSHTFLLSWDFCLLLGFLWLSGFLEGLVVCFFPFSYFVIHLSGRSVCAKNCVPFTQYHLVFLSIQICYLFLKSGEWQKWQKFFLTSWEWVMLWSQPCGWQQCHPVSLQAGGCTENSFIKPFPATPVSSSSPTSTSRILSWCFLAIIYFLSLLFNFLPGEEFMAPGRAQPSEQHK